MEEDNASVHKQLSEMELYFLTINPPLSFDEENPDNVIVNLDKTFGILCSMLESNGSLRASESTVFEFYAKIEYLRKSNTPQPEK